GNRLVTARDGHDAVEHVAARDQLYRVGDHLAADEGTLHTLRAHRDPVGDRDGVDLDGRATRRADPLHHLLGELPVVPVARHRPDPAVRHADLWSGEILVRESHRLHHGARGRAVRAVEEDTALAAGVYRHGGAPWLR